MYEDNKKYLELAKQGDKDALEKIVVNNSGLIWSIVKRFNGRRI